MNKIQITKIEDLCAMKFDENELKKLKKDMEDSIKCIDELVLIDTTDVEDWFDLYELNTYEDKAEDVLSPEELLKNTPKVFKNMISVPNVI